MFFTQKIVKVQLMLAGAALLGWASLAGAAASSCVTCHLDEDMIEGSLAQVKAKKSAMQSGAG